MKTKVLTLFVGLLLAGFAADAQTNLKIGYTNTDYILSMMPKTKEVESDYKSFKAQLETQLKNKMTEFKTKGEAYQKNYTTMTEVVRADNERELQAMQQSIQQFQQEADNSLQNKQVELFQPLLEEIQVAINEVAEANGYTHIFASDAGVSPILLYVGQEDIFTNLVLAKLGIASPDAAPASGN